VSVKAEAVIADVIAQDVVAGIVQDFVLGQEVHLEPAEVAVAADSGARPRPVGLII
jgi:hypothetical protein